MSNPVSNKQPSRCWYWWWCYPTPSEDGDMEELYGDQTVRQPEGLDQRSKMEEAVPKMERRRGSDAGQSTR